MEEIDKQKKYNAVRKKPMTKKDVEEIVSELGIKENKKEKICDEIIKSDDGACFNAGGRKYAYFINGITAKQESIGLICEALKSEPGFFNQKWLSHYVFISPVDKRLIAAESADVRLGDLSEGDIIREAGKKDNKLNIEYDEMRDHLKNEKDENKIKKLIMKIEAVCERAKKIVQNDECERIEEALDNPIDYFVNQTGLYKFDELLQSNFVSIDYESAAKNAVDKFGWANFLCCFDGNYKQTSSGLVWFRWSNKNNVFKKACQSLN